MLGYVCNLKIKTLCLFIVTNSILCYSIIQVVRFIALRSNEIPVPVLIWWTPFMPSNNRIISCSNEAYKCLITKNRTRDYNANLGAYLFYGSHIENNDFPLPRNSNIPWAVFHEESPKNYGPFLFKETQSLFNITSTFSRHSDFPVTLQYLTNISLMTDLKYYIPVDIKNQYLNVISPVLYIQSDCDTPISRDYFVKELGKYVKIDSYGKCLTNKTFPKELSEVYSLDLYNEELLHFISKYKFIIAFENSICDDYVTEKLWRPLIVGSIPIYFGSPTIEDWLPNNNSAILVKNYKSMKTVGDLIKKINENNTMYESFLEHKIKSKVSNNVLEKYILKDHPITAFECFVCENVHKNNYSYKKRNVYNCPKPNVPHKENTWNQHWEIGKCQSKALKLLIDRDQLYLIESFDKTWRTLLHNHNC